MTVARNDDDRETLIDFKPLRPRPNVDAWRQASVTPPVVSQAPSALRSRATGQMGRLVDRQLLSQYWPVLAAGLVVLIGVVWLLYSAHATIDRQDAEIAVLVRNVAAVSNERDALTADRERLRVGLAAEQTRAAAAEANVADLQGRLTAADAQLTSVSAELERAKSGIGTLRDRAQAAQGDARDASSAAAAAAVARRRAETLSAAALAYADASSALSKTRNRMIDLSRQQIAAERAGRYSEADTYVTEYNGLVTVHN